MSARRHLLFRAGRDVLAVPIEEVRQIVPYSAPARLPGAPRHVRGIVQHRGKTMPLVDVGDVYGGEPVQPGAYTLIVIVEHARALSGLLADEVLEIADLGDARALASAESTVVRPLLAGASIVLVLDVARVVEGQGGPHALEPESHP